MNHQIDLLLTHQQRALSDACWQFEQALVDGITVSPMDYVALYQDIPADILLTELEEIQKERHALKQSKDATKPTNVNGRYNLIEEIARGGAAVVWRAFDSHLQRETAVKFLLDSQDNIRMRKRLETEARLCARLAHPGIVPVHELSNFPDGRPFVSMKLVNGQTLLQLLEANPPISIATAIEIFTGVCEAMAYAHSQGIIHRDLKPNNIMVGAFGEIQIMDWGIGKDVDSTIESDRTIMESLEGEAAEPRIREDRQNNLNAMTSPEFTLMGSVIGTLSYMSPEQASGNIVATDRRSDVFSLGAILCRILTGAAPYVAPDNDSLIVMSQKADLRDAHVRLRANRNYALADLSVRCMSLSPHDRPQDAHAVFELLQKLKEVTLRRRRLTIIMVLVASFLLCTSIALWVPKQSGRNFSVKASPKLDVNPRKASTSNSTLHLPKSDQFEAEEQQLQKRSTLNPSKAGNRREQCLALINQERYKEAEDLTRELMELDKLEPEYPFLLSEALYRQGKFQEAYGAMQTSQNRRDQGSPTALPIESKLAFLKQTLTLFNRLNLLDQEAEDHISQGEVNHLASICEITNKVELAIKFYNLWIEMESDEAQRTIHRFYLTNSFCEKQLKRQNLSTSDRILIYKVWGKWLNDQRRFVQRGTSQTKRSQSVIADMQKQLKKQLEVLADSPTVQRALTADGLNEEVLEEFKLVVASLRSM